MLQVTADDGRALATLSDGSYFGEISLLNVGKNGNRSEIFLLTSHSIIAPGESYRKK